MKQGPIAQKVIHESENCEESEYDTISRFHKFVSLAFQKKLKVWSCGASFDIPICENQLRTYGLQIPWMFYNMRCYRTIRQMFDIEAGNKRETVKHNALEDAIYQTECIQKFLQEHPEADK
jgi:exodeoxyribonuclease VIII